MFWSVVDMLLCWACFHILVLYRVILEKHIITPLIHSKSTEGKQELSFIVVHSEIKYLQLH